jgi:cytochrome c oxidase subunit 3
VFLASESMLFAGLLGALAVFRLRADRWPPLGLPRLPVAVTATNSLLLFASAMPITISLRAVRRGDTTSFARSLALATSLGIGFLAIQGSEWVRLVSAGLRASSGPYGATFFTLIGCHALHVLCAVVWLVILLIGARRGRFTAEHHLPVELGAMYWYYVSAVWAVIFPLVYLGLR